MRLIFAALFCVMVSPSAFAEKLPAPVGKPVLTISGLIANTNEGDTAVFDDYTTIVPIDDFHKFPVILALKMNGEYMRIRDKGPLFIVYPYDSSPELQNQIYYSRSAWQVSKIIIE